MAWAAGWSRPSVSWPSGDAVVVHGMAPFVQLRRPLAAGFSRPEAAGVQAVRARVVACAMTSMVPTGSVRIMTWLSLSSGVAFEYLSRRRTITPCQPGQAADAPLSAGRLADGDQDHVGDDDQPPGGAGLGQAERAVKGVDGPAQLLGAVGAAKSVTRAGL